MFLPSRDGTVNDISLVIQTLMSVYMIPLLYHLGGDPGKNNRDPAYTGQ